ncbi:MAG: tyrosine-type recombinase/integrase [Candidatus Dadabacteria bacterium]|nr:tyrosine-type recombinase/integrase [Candidatus Dadabacteria bacterium]
MLIAKGVLRRFISFLRELNLDRFDELDVKSIDGYIDSIQVAAKTKKNHLSIISRMLDQAISEGLLEANPAKRATLPKIIPSIRHRLLEPIDLEIIFKGAGGWKTYYMFLLYTGLRAGDVALLRRENIDLKKRCIKSLIRKTRRIHEFPLADALLALVGSDTALQTPLFPTLYSESERKLNGNLTKPRKFMQKLLEIGGRPKATLHSFRHTFNNTNQQLEKSLIS